MLSSLNYLLQIIKTLLDFWGLRTKPVQQTSPVAVVRRFVQLFEAHGVQRSQIPAFFGHSLTLKDVRDDESILNVLSEDMLQAVTDLFAVRREWLDGLSDEIYPIHAFYKSPGSFKKFLESIHSRYEGLGGKLYVADGRRKPISALLIIQEPVGEIGDKLIYRYHYCDQWIFEYWKCRAYLTACIGIAWMKKIYVRGEYIKPGLMKGLFEGTEFIGTDIFLGGLPVLGSRWPADDLLTNPEMYLSGVDEGVFGKVAALDLWIELADQGYCKQGWWSKARGDFVAALDKYKGQY